MNFWRRLFRPPVDLLALLRAQADHALRALDAVLAWCDQPGDAAVREVFRIENEADVTRGTLVLELSEAFESPLDREDVNDVSRRLDDVVDGMRNMVREASALKVVPDDTLRHMARHIRDGLVQLKASLEALPADPSAALTLADASRHCQRPNDRIYAEALSALIDTQDFRTVLRQREAWLLMLGLSRLVELCGEGLMHAVNKLE